MISPSAVFEVNGAMAVFTCSAGGGPNNSFEWSFMNSSVLTEPVLTLLVNESTFGGYTCEVTNGAGSDTATATLHCE